MYETILVPTDGSAVAERAGEYAIGIADRFDATIHAVYVAEGGLVGDDDGGVADELADRASDRGLEATAQVREADDDVHHELLAAADEHDADLIAMGTTGRAGLGRFLLGSVAQRTLRESPVPVATVHEETALEREFDRLLVPTDGSHSARRALEHAIDLADATGARLDLLHVSGEPVLEDGPVTFDVSEAGPERTVGLDAVDDALERLRESPLETVDVSVADGRVHQQILAAAAERDADAIVMGTHGETGLRRYLLGSSTERVVRFANVPVIGLSPPRAEPVTVEYLDYAVVDERGWDLEEAFDAASEHDLERDAHGTFEAAPDEYVLDAAEAAGLDWPFHCRAGGCVNCAAVVLEGDLEMDVQRSLSEEEVEEENLRLTCVGTPASDSLRLVYNAKHLDSLQDRVI